MKGISHGQRWMVFVGLTISVIVPSAWAGQFEVQEVYYERQAAPTGVENTRVMAGARARYVGPMDDLGNQWNLWTGMRSLGEYVFNGQTKGGRVDDSGDPIDILPSEGAFLDLPNCTPSGQGSYYNGKGVVSIYHGTHFMGMGGGPEIDEKPGTGHRLSCTSTTEEESPSDGEEGGEGTAPGDGTGSGGPTPILIDLDGGNLKLTDLAGGVRFDLDRDGIAESLSWTEPGSGDGWLALDRNGNGRIDDGGELFGDFTDQPPSAAPHGYLALRMFDDDGDGYIGVTDSVFPRLLLWVDRDQDGTSRPSELTDLATAGVQWIDLDVVESRSRDRHGNEFRYKSHVRTRRGMTKSVDVFLLTGP